MLRFTAVIASLSWAVLNPLAAAGHPSGTKKPTTVGQTYTRENSSGIVTLTVIATASKCESIFLDQQSLCKLIDFARGEVIEVADLDIDGDGQSDRIVRTESISGCGTRGCRTDVYLRRSGRLTLATPSLVTLGMVRRCLVSKQTGLQFASDHSLGECFVFRV